MSKLVSGEELFRRNLPALARSISVSRSVAERARDSGQPAIADACDEWIALMLAFIRECGLDDDYERAVRVVAEHPGRLRRLPGQ